MFAMAAEANSLSVAETSTTKLRTEFPETFLFDTVTAE